ncbi:MAG: hypothetical protein PHO64_12030 [Thiomonas sp.]|nr:hypothetical protein [Thiomonas sp.]
MIEVIRALNDLRAMRMGRLPGRLGKGQRGAEQRASGQLGKKGRTQDGMHDGVPLRCDK